MRQFILAGAMALVCAGAQAQFSAELGYTGTTMKAMDDGDSLKTYPAAIRGIVSYEVHHNLSLEGMLAFGLGDSAIKLNGASVAGLKTKLESAMGLYIKRRNCFRKGRQRVLRCRAELQHRPELRHQRRLHAVLQQRRDQSPWVDGWRRLQILTGRAIER